MKQKLLVVLLASVISIGLFAPQVFALELKFGHYAAETHPGHKATLMFAEAVKERTNGDITEPLAKVQKLLQYQNDPSLSK